MEKIINKAAVLIEALPYFQKFRGAIVVVKFGGSAMEDESLIKNTMRDIVFLETVGLKPVVVHGGGKAISARLSELGISTEFINGLRYTCEDTLSVVDDVLHDHVNANLVRSAIEAGGRGEQLSGKTVLKADRAMSTCPETGEKTDIGFVGEITDVDAHIIMGYLERGELPIICPLAKDAQGQTFNINADVAACKIAEALRARKLVFLSDVPGILADPDDPDSLLSSIHIDDVEQLKRNHTISGGMIPKIDSAVHALQSGVNKVHMIDGRVKHSLLLEIFTDSGVGTQIFKA